MWSALRSNVILRSLRIALGRGLKSAVLIDELKLAQRPTPNAKR